MAEKMKSKVIVNNFINNELTSPTNQLSWGKWVQPAIDCPGLKITDLAFYSEGAENSATGTTGWVQYAISGTEYYVHIAWDVPYFGENNFSASVIPSGAPFQATMTGPARGDNNVFTVALNHKIS